MEPLEKNFISTKEASELSGYNSDYLARLCRAGKISGTQVGRTWLISQESLEDFVKSQGERRKELREQLSEIREKEYKHAQSPVRKTTRVVTSAVQKPFDTIKNNRKNIPSPFGSSDAFQKKAVALLASLIVMLVGVTATVAAPVATLAQNTLASTQQLSNAIHATAEDSVNAALTFVAPANPLPAMSLAARTDYAAYVAMGNGIYGSITNVFSGVAFATRHPGTAALAIAYTPANITHDILQTYDDGINAWVNVTPGIPLATMQGLMNVGSAVGNTAGTAPQYAVATFNNAIQSWVTTTPVVAEKLEGGYLALGTGINSVSDGAVQTEITGATVAGNVLYNTTAQVGATTKDTALALVGVKDTGATLAAVNTGANTNPALENVGSGIDSFFQGLLPRSLYATSSQFALATYEGFNSLFSDLGSNVGNYLAIIFTGKQPQIAVVPTYTFTSSLPSAPYTTPETLGSQTISSTRTTTQTNQSSGESNSNGVAELPADLATQEYVQGTIGSLKEYLVQQIESATKGVGTTVVQSSGSSQTFTGFDNIAITGSTFTGGSINTGNLTAGSTTLSSLAVSGGTTVNDLTVNGALTLNGTTTIGNEVVSGATFNNATITNATTTNFFSSLANVTNGTISNLTSSLATIFGLTTTNATSTNATSTNLYAQNFTSDNGTITNVSATTANITNATLGNVAITNSTTTNATSTNLYALNANLNSALINALTSNSIQTGSLLATGSTTLNTLAIGSLNGVLHASNGYVTAGNVDLTSQVSNVLPVANGGTGFGSYSPGIVLVTDVSGNLIQLAPGATGQVLKINASGVPYWGVDETIGGGGSDGIFATSTGKIYPIDTSNVLVLGSNATSSKTAVFEVHGNSYFSSNIGIGSTSPLFALSVEGSSSLGNQATAGYFTATTTHASTFPYASTTALSISNGSGFNLGTVNGLLLGTNGAISAVATSSLNISNVNPSLNGFLKATAGALSTSLINLTSDVSGTLPVVNGGTGSTSFTTNGVVYGNGTSSLLATSQGGANTVLVANNGAPSFSSAITVGTSVTSPSINATTGLTIGSLNGVLKATSGTVAVATAGTDYLAPTSLSAGSGISYNSGTGVISNTGVLSVTNGDGSLTISPTTGSVVASLNTSHANSFSALQQFMANASTTQLTSTGNTYLATSGGSVGVGTTNPQSTLQIGTPYTRSVGGTLSGYALQANGSTLGADVEVSGSSPTGLSIENASLGTSGYGIDIKNYTGTSPSDIFNVTWNGNVGIGTSTPGAALSVAGDTLITGNVIVPSLGNAILKSVNGVLTPAVVGTDYLASTSISATYPIIDTGGNFSLAFGTTTANTWGAANNFTSTLAVGSSSPWAQFSINPNGIAGPSFAIGSSTGTSFIVTNGGYVGIGTTSPAALFSLQGVSPTSGNAPLALLVQGGTGGTLGTGGDITLVTGTGGTGAAGATGSTALRGGNFTITGGVGGVNSSTGSSSSGKGGTLNFTAGAGGLNSITGDNGGAGGDINLTAGTGGNNNGSGFAFAGRGGSVNITAGNSGSGPGGDPGGGSVTLTSGTSPELGSFGASLVLNPGFGSGGGITLNTGNGGTSAFNAGGVFSFQAGNGNPGGGAFSFNGGNATSSGSGGGFTFTGGTASSSLASSTGGGFTVVGGAASSTVSSVGGGAITLTGGSGGTGSLTNGSGGNVTLNGGAAGLAGGTAGNVLLATLQGNVGIGTTSPSQLLSVSGNTLIHGNLTVDGLGSAMLKSVNGVLTPAVVGTDYLASTSISATYPIINTAGNFSLAFGTTTANTWGALQTFTSGITTNSLTFSGGGNGPLQVNNGVVSATTTIGLLYGGTATSTFYNTGVVYSDGTKLTQASGTGNSIFDWNNTLGALGLGSSSPSANLSILTASAANGAGANALTSLYVQGGTGGSSSGSPFVAGTGSGVTLIGGNGGVQSGTSSIGGGGGGFILTGGNGGNSTNSTSAIGGGGGSVFITGGNGGSTSAISAIGGGGGNIVLTGGDSGAGNISNGGGSIQIVGGNSYATTNLTLTPGGGLTVTGGNGFSGGGGIQLTGGNATSTGSGGGFTFTGGVASSTGTGSHGGSVSITAGAASSTDSTVPGGSITLTGGSGGTGALTNGSGGSITLNGGAPGLAGGTAGNVLLATLRGNVGIGTTSPWQNLSISGNLALTGGLFDSTASEGTNGQLLLSTGSTTQWTSTSTLGLEQTLTPGTGIAIDGLGNITNTGVTALSSSNGSLTITNSGTAYTANLNVAHANTFSALQTFNSGITTSGTVTLGSNSGVLYGVSGVVNSVATSTPTLGLGLSYSGTLGSFVGGASGALSIATSSLYTGTTGQVPYFSGTNTLSATSTLFIDSSGNVGIGTTTPTNPLTIPAGSASIPSLSFGDTGTGFFRNASGQVSFASSGLTKWTFTATDFSTAGGNAPGLSASIGVSVRPRDVDSTVGLAWDSTGVLGLRAGNASVDTETLSGSNVGIGTTSPWQNLSVAGNLALTGGFFDGAASEGTNGQVLLSTGTATQWTSTSTLGLEQTLTPGTGISIDGLGNITNTGVTALSSSNGSLTITNSGTAYTANLNVAHANTFTALQQFNANASTTQLTTTGSTYLATTGGNVGIGTTTPGSLLSVGGIANFTTATSTFYSTGGINITGGCFSINGTCVSGGGSFSNTLANGGTATTTFYNGGVVFSDGTKLTQAANSGAAALFWDNVNNRLGIGTSSPYATLAVSGSQFIDSSSATAFTVGQNGTTSTAFLVNNAAAGTGLSVIANTPGNGVTLQATSPAINENIALTAKASGTASLVGNTSQLTVNTGQIGFQVGSGNKGSVTSSQWLFQQVASNSTASTNRFQFLGGADTNLTAGTEATDFYINLGQTRQHASNTALSLQRDLRVTGSTHSFATAGGTVSTAGVFSIDGPDSGGTNATIGTSTSIYLPTSALTNVTTGIGLYVEAPTGATNNYAAVFNGNVGIGTSSPGSLLSVGGSAYFGGPITVGSAGTAATTTLMTDLAVGNNGTTNPAFQVLGNVTSAATGLEVIPAAAGSGVVLQTTSTLTNENLFINSKGGGNINISSNGGSVALKTSFGNSWVVGSQAITGGVLGSSLATARFGFTGGTDTNLTAGTEAADAYFNFGQTRTHAGNTNIPLQRDFRITAPTHAFVSTGGTITSAAAFEVDGPDNAGTNATIASSSAIYVPSSSLSSSVTNSYGLSIFGSSGATNNYAAEFMNGNVGIGTSSPASTLTVTGALCVSQGAGSATALCGTTAGNEYATAFNTGAYDLAENYLTEDSTATLPGTIVALDTARGNEEITTAAQGAAILGVVSTDPGLRLGGADASTVNKMKAPVALSGRVPVSVDMEGGPIAIGDRIALSSTPGVGMKATQSGQTVGIALQAASASGKIDVFVQPQYYFAPADLSLNTTASSTDVVATSSPTNNLTVSGDLAVVNVRASGQGIFGGSVSAPSFISTGNIGAQTLTATDSVSAPAYVVPGVGANLASQYSSLTFGSSTIADALTNNGSDADIFKLATFALNGVQQLATQTDSLSTQLQSLTARVVALENATNMSTSSLAAAVAGATQTASTTSPTDLATTTVVNALSDMGVLLEKGIAQFNTLVVRDLVFSKDGDGTSAAGSGTIPAGETTVIINNSHMLASSQVSVTLTSPMTGNWFVTNKQNGSFQVTLSQTQTTDVTFDYLIVQTTGQIATSTPIGASNTGSFSISSWLASLFGGSSTSTNTTTNSTTQTPATTSSSTGGETGTGSSTSTATSTSASGITVTLKGDAAMSVDQGGVFTDPGATATDASSTDISSSITESGSVDTNTPGMYTLTYTAKDANGATGSASRVVTVTAQAQSTSSTNSTSTTSSSSGSTTTTSGTSSTSSSSTTDSSSTTSGSTNTTSSATTTSSPTTSSGTTSSTDTSSTSSGSGSDSSSSSSSSSGT